jgi:hypothetical protein
MARLEKFENSGKTSKYDVEDLLAEFDNKLKQVNAMLGKNNSMKKTGTNEWYLLTSLNGPLNSRHGETMKVILT